MIKLAKDQYTELEVRVMIETALEDEGRSSNDYVAIDFDGRHLLWIDEESLWCVNSFTITDGKVEFAPMPEMSFKD